MALIYGYVPPRRYAIRRVERSPSAVKVSPGVLRGLLRRLPALRRRVSPGLPVLQGSMLWRACFLERWERALRRPGSLWRGRPRRLWRRFRGFVGRLWASLIWRRLLRGRILRGCECRREEASAWGRIWRTGVCRTVWRELGGIWAVSDGGGFGLRTGVR